MYRRRLHGLVDIEYPDPRSTATVFGCSRKRGAFGQAVVCLFTECILTVVQLMCGGGYGGSDHQLLRCPHPSQALQHQNGVHRTRCLARTKSHLLCSPNDQPYAKIQQIRGHVRRSAPSLLSASTFFSIAQIHSICRTVAVAHGAQTRWRHVRPSRNKTASD